MIDLMRETFGLLDPMTIVNKFAEIHKNVGNHNEAIADELWAAFDDKTRRTFANGCECLARIWLSAWEATGGDAAHLGAPAKAASPDTLRDEYYMKHNFVQSYTLDEIEPHLRRVRRAPAMNAAY